MKKYNIAEWVKDKKCTKSNSTVIHGRIVMIYKKNHLETNDGLVHLYDRETGLQLIAGSSKEELIDFLNAISIETFTNKFSVI